MFMNKGEIHTIFIGIRNNNELEFNRLYERYKSLVYGVAFSILKNREDSEEIVQMVFIKIFRLEKEKLPQENEASWLYTLSKNTALNFLRNKKEELNIDEVYYITDEDKELNEVIDKDTYNRIISKLNKKEQEIVSLKILSNLSFKEISNILNIPIGTVQWKYYKSLHTLKILLGNLSAYIVTVGLLISNRIRSKHQRAEKLETKNNTEISTEQESTKKETLDELEKEHLRGEENTSNDNEKSENTQENTITFVSEDSTSIKPIDIGLISISTIFLITTITFFIIFIKHQQNQRKNVSK